MMSTVRITPINTLTKTGAVTVADNDVRYTDDAAFTITKGEGALHHADVLRNRLHMIGLRPFRQSDAHALTVGFPTTMEIAGNMLSRTYGAGIFLFFGADTVLSILTDFSVWETIVSTVSEVVLGLA